MQSQQVTIFRAQVPFLRLFEFRQPQIRPRLIPIPILHEQTHSIQTARSRTQACEANTDLISRLIVRRVFRLERICRNNASDVTKTDLPRRTNSAPMMSANVEIEPAYCDWKCGIGAHGHEEQGTVFEMLVMVGCEEDREAGYGHGDWDKSEEEAVF